MQKNTYLKADHIIALSILFCAVLTGGFYWHTCIIPCALLLIYILYKRDFSLTWQSIGLLIMLFAGFVSIIFSKGDKQNALYEFEKILCFVLSVYAGSKCKNADFIKGCIVLAALIISISGLLAYSNIIKSSAFVFFDRNMIRLQSFIQYANTTAVILACGYFFTLDSFKKNKIIIVISQCILLAFYLTVSKSGIILYLLLGTGLIFVKREYSERFIIQNFCGLAFFFLLEFTALNHMHALSFILIALCIFLSLPALNLKINTKLLALLWIICLTGSIIAVIIFTKLTGFDFFSTFEKRIDYMKDACKLVKDNLLIGIGPGAWKYYQFSVQTTQYNVKYIHNGWLQFLTENGLVFVLPMCVIIAASLKSLYKSRNYSFLICIVLIILHSLIDFDLSFGIILMILGLMLGSGITTHQGKRWFKITNILVIMVVISTMIYMCSEFFIRNNFEKAYLNENYDAALKKVHLLERICPYDSNLQLSIAALDETNAEKHIEKARLLSPFDPNITEQCIKYYIYSEKNVIDLINQYIDLMPKQETAYVNAFEFLKQTRENGGCSQEEYDNLKEYLNMRQEKEQVINRNQLLNSID